MTADSDVQVGEACGSPTPEYSVLVCQPIFVSFLYDVVGS